MKNPQPFITTDWKKMINQYWQEHDGDHFYKDELKEVVKEILSLQKERLIKEVRELPDEPVGLSNDDYNAGFRACKEDILRRLQSV